MEPIPDQAADHGAWEYEPASDALRWSPALFRIHGLEPGATELSLSGMVDLVHEDDRSAFREMLDEAIEKTAPFTSQHRIVRPGEEIRILAVRGSFVSGEGAPDRLIGTIQDVTANDGEEDHAWHLANHDSLSGLYNRRRFIEELEREVATAERTKSAGAVAILDIDDFKSVNDSLGHMVGDALLAKVGRELRSGVRVTDTVARVAADEFAVILPGCSIPAARALAEKLIRQLSEEGMRGLGSGQTTITASVGMTPFGTTGHRTSDELLVEADLAVQHAKSTGRARAVLFTEEMRRRFATRASTEGELREALGGQELCVHYQPVIGLEDGSVVGCEALVRWQHPARGMVGPTDFVSVAEESGLIGRIGRFVLSRSCLHAAKWRRDGHEIFVSVNVSPLQLVHSDIVDDVSRALAASGLPPHLLCLEITETSILRETRPVLPTLSRLRALGVRIAIDDFGGGASSLGLLRLLPVDQIKIDRLFVASIAEHPSDRAIVAAIISLASELGLTVVAEGVETERQLDELRALGTQYAQGYLFARPKEMSELDLGRVEGRVAQESPADSI